MSDQQGSFLRSIAEFFVAHIDFISGALAGSLLRASVKKPTNLFGWVTMIITGISMSLLFTPYLTDALGLSVIVAAGLLAMVGEEFARRIIDRVQKMDLPGPLNSILGPPTEEEEANEPPIRPVRKKGAMKKKVAPKGRQNVRRTTRDR